MVKKNIPNFITCLNLLCGCIGIVFAFEGNLIWSAYLVGLAAIFDFLDGFVARMLNVHSEIGKQLDSLADMVTFGVLPGLVMFHLIDYACTLQQFNPANISLTSITSSFSTASEFNILPYFAFLIPVFSALRLAKFNVDTRQTNSFIGLPTPANSILICSIPLIIGNSIAFLTELITNLKATVQTISNPFSILDSIKNFDLDNLLSNIPAELPSLTNLPWQISLLNPYLLIGITVICSLLLVAPLPLFALKFKSFGFNGNEIRFIFILLSIPMLIIFKYVAIPLTVILYIVLSIINNLLSKKQP